MVEMAKVKTSIFLTVVTGNMFMLLSSMTISGVAMEIREIFEKDLAVHTDWMTKIALFGAVIGALLFCGIADILGRKITLLIIGLFMFITFVMNMVTFEHKGLILLGRCVQGMCFGGVYGVLPIYLAEIAEKSSRGLVMSTALLTYQLGQLLMIFVQWFATFFVYNTVMAILAVLSSILFYFFGHETPYYLVKKNKENIAKIVLEKIRNSSQNKIDDELDDILGRAAESGKEKIMTCFKGNGWLKSLVILIALNHLAHLSGSTFIFLQSHQFINDAFAGRTSFLYTGLTIGVTQIVSCLTCAILIDRIGRKACLLTSTGGVILSLFCFSLYSTLQKEGIDLPSSIPFVIYLTYHAFFCFGIFPVPFVFLGELFSSRIRMWGAAFIVAYYWLASSGFTNLIFSFLEYIQMYYISYIFTLNCIIALVLMKFCILETRGKSLSGIQIILNRH